MSTRKVVLALAGTAVGTLLVVGVKGAQAPPDAGDLGQAGPQPADLGSVPTRPVPTGSHSETGPVVTTPFGPVQVKVDVVDGKITEVTTLQLPSAHGLSVELSGYAAPILHREVLTSQTASVDVVSGATYTSNAYAQSLQAALDQAAGG